MKKIRKQKKKNFTKKVLKGLNVKKTKKVLPEKKEVHNHEWAKRILRRNESHTLQDYLDYKEALQIVMNSGENFMFIN